MRVYQQSNRTTAGKPILCFPDNDSNFIFIYLNIQRVTFSKQHKPLRN